MGLVVNFFVLYFFNHNYKNTIVAEEFSEVISDSHINLSSATDSDKQQVEQQLVRILASPQFKSAQQMQRFLEYIIAKTLVGEEKELKQYTIAVEALGFPDDFDSDSNPAVRILGGRVRDRLTKYYEDEEKYSLLITIPKGTYIPLIEKISFEKSPNKTQQAIKHQKLDSQGPKLGLFCFEDETPSKESNRLLINISSTLAKELSHFLFSRLYVLIPYTGDTRENLIGKEAKEKHNVDFSLLLFIQELPKNKYELVYRLWDNDSEEVIDSEILEVSPGQSEKEQNNVIYKISAVVADLYQGKLQTYWARKLLKDEGSIPERYQTVVYYRYYADNLGPKTYEKAVHYCLKALERNPQDVIANVMFADYCRRDYVYNYNVIEAPLEKGKASAEMATRLRPDSHEAHFALGQVLFCLNEWKRSISEFNLARDISINHAVIEYGTGFHFCLMGRWEEGLALTRKAMALSGSYPDWYHFLPFLDHYRNHRYEDALVDALKITTPNIMHGHIARCASYGQLGDIENAQRAWKDLSKNWCPNFLERGEQILGRFLGDKELAGKVWDGIIKTEKIVTAHSNKKIKR